MLHLLVRPAQPQGFYVFVRALQLLKSHNDGVVVVGLAGASGSGKTAFSEKVGARGGRWRAGAGGLLAAAHKQLLKDLGAVLSLLLPLLPLAAAPRDTSARAAAAASSPPQIEMARAGHQAQCSGEVASQAPPPPPQVRSFMPGIIVISMDMYNDGSKVGRGGVRTARGGEARGCAGLGWAGQVLEAGWHPGTPGAAAAAGSCGSPPGQPSAPSRAPAAGAHAATQLRAAVRRRAAAAGCSRTRWLGLRWRCCSCQLMLVLVLIPGLPAPPRPTLLAGGG
jgi:hypothetical protein